MSDNPHNSEAKRIELRSDEVQEIMGKTPHWLLRWGTTVVLLVILVLLGLSWFVQYPDIVKGRVTIMTENPPIPLVARSSGQVEELFVEDGDSVAQGELIGVIQSPADYSQVLQLEALMDSVEYLWKDTARPPVLPDFNDLGSVQVNYSDFVQQYELYRFQTGEDLAETRIRQLQSQIAFYQELNQTYSSQKKTLEADLKIAADKYFSDVTLMEKGVIAQRDLDASEASYYQKKFQLESADVSIISNNLEIQKLQKEIQEIELGDFESISNKTVMVQESLNQLQSSIENWKQKFLLRAPISGKVSFFNFWSENQYVEMGSEVLTIVPLGGLLTGKISLAQVGSGKVNPGQKVNIKLDGFPYEEFGIVEGQVQGISAVPKDNAYLIEVNLVDGLQTSHGKELEFYQEMQGNAEIVTEDKRLIERIFYNLRKVFER
jgi:HlyD family secretion protein